MHAASSHINLPLTPFFPIADEFVLQKAIEMVKLRNILFFEDFRQ
jgi:hypothetical protein